AAGDAGVAWGGADGGGAVVPGEAVGIDRAVPGAGGGTARVRRAGDVLLGRAGASPFARGSQHRHARVARRIAAGRAVARIRAGGRVGSVAGTSADRPVGSASGPRAARSAGDGRAGPHAAGLGASLALTGTR